MYEVIKMAKKKNKKKEFSKTLLIQESALIWVTTISSIILAFYCVVNQYFSELPWVAAMIGFPWTAYGVSQACYYRKAEKENTKGGIKYDSVVGAATNYEEETGFEIGGQPPIFD